MLFCKKVLSLYDQSVDIYITIYVYVCMCVCVCVRVYIYIYIYLNGGINVIFELSQLENPANTYMQHTEHWTAVSTLLDLISSAYRDLHYRRLNQQPQNAEAETLPLGHWFISHISEAKLTSHGDNVWPLNLIR